MKEATGEASMTGITIAVIAIIAAVAVPFITNLVNNMSVKSCCTSLGGSWSDADATCTITKSDASQTKIIGKNNVLDKCK